MEHNWYAHCAKCGTRQEKKKMQKLYTAEDRNSSPRVLCHLCRHCFLRLLEELEVSM